MKRSGQMWIRDDDPFMDQYFDKTGDKFEIDHLDAALKFCASKRTAIDVGAHYGSWSRYLSRQFGQVFSFEPIPATFECCKENLSGFENVTLEKAAVGDRIGQVSVGIGKMYNHPGMETIVAFEGDTKMITLDSLGLTEVDFIKIDVEGFELSVLKGAADLLVRDKPIIVFEENVRGPLEHNIPNGACGAFLKSLGARLLDVKNKDFIYGWTAERSAFSWRNLLFPRRP